MNAHSAPASACHPEPPVDWQTVTQNLPRLLYVGDVPVEATVAGAALLFRLLENYPAERLAIAFSNLRETMLSRRLPGVAYFSLSMPGKRALQSRFCRSAGSAFYLRAGWRLGGVRRLAKDFRPEAILTVGHGYTWRTAARLADKLDIPLHLILHDSLLGTLHAHPWLHRKIHADFGRVYRRAVSRFCVSPFMAEAYEQHYGAPASVLYPSRSATGPRFASPPERIRHNDHPLVFGYAGSVYDLTYASVLRHVAEHLARRGGRLVIYSELDTRAAQELGLDLPNVDIQSIIPSEQLIHQLRQENDGLVLPMRFAAEDRHNMEVSFPSKLTDYTSAQLPLLIWGPSYCSAVRWAQEVGDVAEVVTGPDKAAGDEAMERLAGGEHRWRLATRAAQVGNKYFGHTEVTLQFYRGLARALSGEPAGRNSHCQSVAAWEESLIEARRTPVGSIPAAEAQLIRPPSQAPFVEPS